VITGDSPAVREEMQHEQHLFLVERANPQAIADAVLKLIDDSSLREKLALNGYELFASRFTNQVLGAQLKDYLTDLLAGEGSGRKLRILFLVTQDLESPSCLGRFFPLARYFARLGHEVSLVTLHSDYSASVKINLPGRELPSGTPAKCTCASGEMGKTYFSAPALVFISLKSTLALTMGSAANES